MFRSKLAAVGTGLYLLAFVCAAIYPMFDRRTFSGLAAVMLALPWIDYLPSALWLFGVVFNAVIIYVLLAALSAVPALLRGSRS
jgi:hypothetical protein